MCLWIKVWKGKVNIFSHLQNIFQLLYYWVKNEWKSLENSYCGSISGIPFVSLYGHVIRHILILQYVYTLKTCCFLVQSAGNIFKILYFCLILLDSLFNTREQLLLPIKEGTSLFPIVCKALQFILELSVARWIEQGLCYKLHFFKSTFYRNFGGCNHSQLQQTTNLHCLL